MSVVTYLFCWFHFPVICDAVLWKINFFFFFLHLLPHLRSNGSTLLYFRNNSSSRSVRKLGNHFQVVVKPREMFSFSSGLSARGHTPSVIIFFHNSLVVISCQSSSNLQICSLSFIRYLSSGCMWINISEWLYVVWYWRFSRIGTSQGQLFYYRRFSPHDGSSQGVPWDPFSYRSKWSECTQWVQPFDSRSV